MTGASDAMLELVEHSGYTIYQTRLLIYYSRVNQTKVPFK